MNKKILIKNLNKLDYDVYDDKKSIIILRPNSKYHFHIFEHNNMFYIEFPPEVQHYSNETINTIYQDFLIFKEIVLNGWANVITDKIVNEIGYYSK